MAADFVGIRRSPGPALCIEDGVGRGKKMGDAPAISFRLKYFKQVYPCSRTEDLTVLDATGVCPYSPFTEASFVPLILTST